ncbi:MAG: sigma-54-dependent Fis family transcriptional regulator [Gammaproteobacteria bacterium]|nr:sigma-54-dependent Fis family transcriptional regulator [Gammaproteobacteria bacterium]
MKARALIVDDEPALRELVAITLGRMEVECTGAPDLASARRALAEQAFDFCLTDMRLPDGNGLSLIEHIQRHHAGLPVAMITAHGSMETAIEALKGGAFDFVNKPVDITDLRNLVAQALKVPPQEGKGPPADRSLIGESPAMAQLREKVRKVARSQAPVYINGESGTGKELVARLIHAQGPRAAGPFVPVNCGALPAELVESELFGHLKGSFTGATADRPGLFQAAHGGTLFLDEVADLPLPMQVKLLRAIQEKRVRPVGAAQEEAVDCRILSATHQSLSELVAAGRFRQDLYYRINVIELKMPPLRERGEDVLLIAEHYLAALATEGEPLSLDEQARAALLAYPFPGNVRELENILERAAALSEGEVIGLEALPLDSAEGLTPYGAEGSGTGIGPALAAEAAGQAGAGPVDEPVTEPTERARLLEALEKTRWNRTKAAQLLGMSLRALRYRLSKLGLE